MSRPTSIRIFLTDGTPDGVRTVEKSNWTGRAVVASRALLSEALADRDELNRPGVYVLTGTDDDGARRLYVGEADDLSSRLRNHAAKKDFWTSFVAFSSTDHSLNKAHVRYLEAKLIELANRAKQWELENSVSPGEPPLSEADRADAEWFLAEMLVIYPVLGIDAFEQAEGNESAGDGPGELFLAQRGAEGRGRETKDGFVVYAGSRARIEETNSIHAYQSELRARLVDRGVLLERDGQYEFAQDYRFDSPSMASAVLVAGNSNGRRAWKTRDGRELKQVQEGL